MFSMCCKIGIIMAKDLTAVRIDGELIKGLQKISAKPGTFYSERTVSWLISQAVKEFITQHVHGKTKPLPSIEDGALFGK